MHSLLILNIWACVSTLQGNIRQFSDVVILIYNGKIAVCESSFLLHILTNSWCQIFKWLPI